MVEPLSDAPISPRLEPRWSAGSPTGPVGTNDPCERWPGSVWCTSRPYARTACQCRGCGICVYRQGGNYGPELSGGGARSPGRAVEPLAVDLQVAAGDPALHRAVLLVDRIH